MFDHGHKVFCMMTSQIPMSRYLLDVLLENAYDMWWETRKSQRIKGRDYDGFITSDLQHVEHPMVGVGVAFTAIISTSMWTHGTVMFMVRVEDLDGIEHSSWQPQATVVSGMLPASALPRELQEKIEGGEEITFEDLPPQIQAVIKDGMRRAGMGEDDFEAN